MLEEPEELPDLLDLLEVLEDLLPDLLDEPDLLPDLLEEPDLLPDLLDLLDLLDDELDLEPLLSAAAAWRASSLVGILILSPALILLPSWMPLARSRSLTDTPWRSAILVRDSPFCTVTSVGCLGLDCFLLRLLLELCEDLSLCLLRDCLSAVSLLLDFSAYLALRERHELVLVFAACCRAL